MTAGDLLSTAKTLAAALGCSIERVAKSHASARLPVSAESIEAILEKKQWIAFRHRDRTDYPAYADFEVCYSRRDPSLVVIAQADLVDGVSRLMDLFIDACGSVISGCYAGYAYSRAYRRGPAGFAYGLDVNPGRKDEQESEEIARWNYASDFGRYRGYVRDVYAESFLSEALDMDTISTLGGSLLDWIQQDRARGSIREVLPGLNRWTVEPANIPRVREELFAQGALIIGHGYGCRSQLPR